MCVFLERKISVSTHAYCEYISSGSLAMIRSLCTNDKVFELSQNNPFVTGCGHRTYVDFSMLITWISGREDCRIHILCLP